MTRSIENTILETLQTYLSKKLTNLGYNFKSLEHIKPYMEPTTSGVTTDWARATASKYGCFVTVGYPELEQKSNPGTLSKYFNSSVTLNPEGNVVVNYRKSFLYYTDETWASEGPGFFGGEIPALGNVAMGICKFLS
jgi:protein N-terminal amidase